MDAPKICELAKLLRNNGDKILNSEFTLTLSGSMLHALNAAFDSIVQANNITTTTTNSFQVTPTISSTKPYYRDLQLIYDFVQKTTLLCLLHYATEPVFVQHIDIGRFHALKRLEVHKLRINQITGIQKLRGQLQQLICQKSLQNVDEIITHCGGDQCNGFVWNELKLADFSHNQLQSIDTALEFAQYLQHLNLRHNQLHSVEAIKWLPHLKTLDLSYNCLSSIPLFHVEACKRLQSLNVSHNSIEQLYSIVKLDALAELDLSHNLLLEHSALLPLSMLLTLKFLNLFGNPLYCHPKHRLATAQYLHKNCQTVKFLLDYAPLSKSEKSATGKHQPRHITAVAGLSMRSSNMSINRLTASATQTPASSVGSLRSFMETSTNSNNSSMLLLTPTSKRRNNKVRQVEIKETETTNMPNDESIVAANLMQQQQTSNDEHLQLKKQMEDVREKYGANWLQYANPEMLQSMQGNNCMSDSMQSETERNNSHQQFNAYFADAFGNSETATTLLSSTPKQQQQQQIEQQYLVASKQHENDETTSNESTLYKTAREAQQTEQQTNEKYSNSGVNSVEQTEEQVTKELENGNDYSPIFNVASDVESDISDEEDDELVYIVNTDKSNTELFLTMSSQFLRERDPITRRTNAKWSLKILESCDRIKSNTLRINFDTVRRDKQERVYTVEEGLCQELENKLRNILSERDLSEMNQTIYHCVNCCCQFSRENKNNAHVPQDVCCPYCRSTFVDEIHETNTQFDKISPAVIVEEAPIATPLIVKKNISAENHSIGAIKSSSKQLLPTANTQKANAIRSTSTKQTLKSSANSLHESSSCSKLSSHSQNSFDSNQSVVGSSNTERELDFKHSNMDSDVDIISNPSQSSIEVLVEHYNSRKTSVSQAPNLDTINDNSYSKQSFLESELEHVAQLRRSAGSTSTMTVDGEPVRVVAKQPQQQNAQFNLTESSSSGSVTDSVCTAYEQQAQTQATKQLLLAESQNEQQADLAAIKNDASISSKFGAFLQSTNSLLKSKRFLDAESYIKARDGTAISSSKSMSVLCAPYQFDFNNLSIVDHRLKLYFCAQKFKGNERFLWCVRAHVLNEQTRSLFVGVLVMSNFALYLMEAYADEQEDVSKWLRMLVSVTVNRLESVQLLPWKIGLAFQLRDWGGFLLLLQDILRTDSLLLHFANNGLPSSCEMLHTPDTRIVQRLNAVSNSNNERLNMCALLNGCYVQRSGAKRTLGCCTLLTTDTQLYLSTDNLNWLSLTAASDDASDVEICMLQFVHNLMEVQRKAHSALLLTFRDDILKQDESWCCTFETDQNAESCLNAIAQSWEQIHGVPLQLT